MRKIIIIITCTCNGSPWFSWYTAKVWHAAAFSCNLREASALMRISSNYILYLCKIAHALRVSKHVTESIRNIARGVGINLKMAAPAEVSEKTL